MWRVKQNLTVGRAANQRRRLPVEPSRRYLALNNLLPQRQTERGLHFRMTKDCCPSTRPTLFDPGLSLTPAYAVFVRRFSRSSCFLSFSAAANTVLQSASWCLCSKLIDRVRQEDLNWSPDGARVRSAASSQQQQQQQKQQRSIPISCAGPSVKMESEGKGSAENATAPKVCMNKGCKKVGAVVTHSSDPCGCFFVCISCAMKMATGGKCKICGQLYVSFRAER